MPEYLREVRETASVYPNAVHQCASRYICTKIGILIEPAVIPGVWLGSNYFTRTLINTSIFHSC